MTLTSSFISVRTSSPLATESSRRRRTTSCPTKIGFLPPRIFQALLQAPLPLLFYWIADLVDLLLPVAQMIHDVHLILATAQTPKALLSPPSFAHPPTTVTCKFPRLSWGARWDLVASSPLLWVDTHKLWGETGLFFHGGQTYCSALSTL